MNSASRQIVAVIDTSQIARREKLSGVFAAANERRWSVRPLTKPLPPAALDEFFEGRKPDGFVIDGFEPPVRLPRRLLGDVPTVYLDGPSRRRRRTATVNHDNVATAEAAAETLARIGSKSFAIVGPKVANYYSKTRAEAFSRKIAERTGLQAKAAVADHQLGDFLANLPRPCALLAVTDAIGQRVIETAAALGISIPEELAVLGIDNDELVCENCSPSLSSIEPDFRRGGRLAAEKLAAMIDGRDPEDVPSLYGYRALVVRRSTLRLAYNSKAVREALEYIRTNACFGIKAKDVIRSSPLPKSTLELHFRRATGRAIAEVIRETRLENVKRLLAESGRPLSEIADRCGFASANHLKNLFKSVCGQTLSQYRAAAKRQAPQMSGADRRLHCLTGLTI